MDDSNSVFDDTNKTVTPPPTDDDIGENSASGTTPDPDEANQVDKNYKAAFGNNPKGETIAEEVDEDEKNLQEI